MMKKPLGILLRSAGLVLALFAGVVGSASAQEVGGIRLEYDTNRTGSHYDKFRVNDARQCARECSRENRCRAFAFNQNNGMCRLLAGTGRVRYQERFVSGSKRRSQGSGGSGSSAIPLDYDTNRIGGDYTNFRVDDVQQCVQRCSRDNRCRAFAYNWNNGRCWLKEQANSPSPQRGIVSGAKRGGGGGGSGSVAGIPLEYDTNRLGWDYTQTRTSGAAQCARECSRDRRCRAFAYAQSNGKCWLKEKASKPTPQRGIVSGAKRGGGSGSGKPPPREIAGIRIYDNEKRSGGDYRTFRAGNVQKCAQACANDRRCRSFNYGKERGDCNLKDNVPRGEHNRSVISGVKKGGASSDRPREIAGIRIDYDLKRSGGDYRSFDAGSLSRCARSCAQDRRCAAFNYGKEHGDCHLKDNVPRGEHNRSVISGVKKGGASSDRPREIAGIRIDYDLKRSGGDYRSFDAGSLSRCARSCAQDRRCAAFNYGKEYGDCHLKDNVPKGRRNTSVISGVKENW